MSSTPRVAVWLGGLALLLTLATTVLLVHLGWTTPRGLMPPNSGSPPASVSQGGLAGVHWIINGAALRKVLAIDPVAAAAAFDNPQTYVLFDGASQKPSSLPEGWTSVITLDFKSEAQLQQTLQAGVPYGVAAVLYDNEAWSFTPLQEQSQPATYEAMAAEVVHAQHLVFIASPAVDLTKVLEPNVGDRYASYLRLDIAGDAARHADVVDIQAQRAEGNITQYAAFVRAAAAQARAANSRVVVLAGVTTQGAGTRVELLTAAATAIKRTVAGYWLNIPGQSAACGDCSAPRPDIGARFLEELRTRGAA